MIFKKKPRLPRKEKKRRAKLLNPYRVIKHTPYAGLTYEKLASFVADTLVPKPDYPLESYRMVFLDDLPDNVIKTENLTLDEIKERFPITEKEEEALQAQIGLGSEQDVQTNEETKTERG